MSITIRQPESIYQIEGDIENGSFHGRWHFSFGEYADPEYTFFGSLRVFNDDTLSPGAVWPLHPHREIEVVTYCAAGEFRHADERGVGGVLKKGWVQHTTVGRGMWHSEINNRKDLPMRFIQMWFIPASHGLEPSVEQKEATEAERADRFLPLVSNRHAGALSIASDADVYSSRLRRGARSEHSFSSGRGGYLYVLEGGPVLVNEQRVPALGAAAIRSTARIAVEAEGDAELLLIEVPLAK